MTRLGRTCRSDINSLYEYVVAYLASFLLVELTASVALYCWHRTLARGVALKLTRGWYFIFIYLQERKGQPLKVTTLGSFETSENKPVIRRHTPETWILKVVEYFERKNGRWGCPETEWRGNLSANEATGPYCLTTHSMIMGIYICS